MRPSDSSDPHDVVWVPFTLTQFVRSDEKAGTHHAPTAATGAGAVAGQGQPGKRGAQSGAPGDQAGAEVGSEEGPWVEVGAEGVEVHESEMGAEAAGKEGGVAFNTEPEASAKPGFHTPPGFTTEPMPGRGHMWRRGDRGRGFFLQSSLKILQYA